jgi:hypothetical protein
MSSAPDPAKPQDGFPDVKSALRANLQRAKDDIASL